MVSGGSVPSVTYGTFLLCIETRHPWCDCGRGLLAVHLHPVPLVQPSATLLDLRCQQLVGQLLEARMRLHHIPPSVRRPSPAWYMPWLLARTYQDVEDQEVLRIDLPPRACAAELILYPVFAARVPPDMRCGESIDTRTNADVCTNTSRHCLVSRLFLLPPSTAPRHNHRLHHPLLFFSACFYNHLSTFFFVISPQHEPERGAAGAETDQLSESGFDYFTPPTSS